jgi:acyl-CoA reductase-like NAD-dependent aldehyde dehydrogenase
VTLITKSEGKTMDVLPHTYEALLGKVTEPTGRPMHDPATGEFVGHAPVRSVEDLDNAVRRARAAQTRWAARSDEERVEALLRAADAVEASAEALAELLCREQGKPLNGPNARFEVGACAAWLRATATTPLPGGTVFEDEETHAELHYRPVGVVGAIGPWNWPMMITIWQVAPSLRMGNTVVVKPSEYTPLSVLALGEVLNRVLPDDVLAVVPGEGDLGAHLTTHPDVDKLMFTGSTRTGKAIARNSADTLKRLTLELGGNDAGIVLPDVDPSAIAEGLFWGAFINTGQTCAALKRLYVHTDVYDQVCDALVEVARQMPMGPGLE